MKITLSTRTSQTLALTPQLQQAIRLLALSNLELRQELEQATLENPLLELEEVSEDEPAPLADPSEEDAERERDEAQAQALDSERASDDVLRPLDAPSDPQSLEDPTDSGPEAAEPPNHDELHLDNGDGLTEWGTGSGAGSGEDDGPEGQESSSEGLVEHLRGQIAGLKLSHRDRAWLEILVSSLDEDGYLRDDLEELAEGFASVFEESFGGSLEPEELLVGLRLLQSLDPVGVGARSVEECLLIQLGLLDEDPLIQETAKILITNHLDHLGSMPANSLAKACGLDREQVQAALDLIRRLEPRPASAFNTQQAQFLIPDVIVFREKSGRWAARLSQSALPKLHINPLYARLIREGAGDSSLAQKLQEARWMVKNIEQRSETILKVSQAIVAAQQTFFDLGPKAMRPLILRDIAEACELHESTVSRVTTQKFMLTPLGCYELKFFFSSHVGTDDGGAASATALKAQISDWIREEDARRPLSDQAIADRFGQQGVVIARRTVAKYREGLRIPSASLRKRS